MLSNTSAVPQASETRGRKYNNTETEQSHFFAVVSLMCVGNFPQDACQLWHDLQCGNVAAEPPYLHKQVLQHMIEKPKVCFTQKQAGNDRMPHHWTTLHFFEERFWTNFRRAFKSLWLATCYFLRCLIHYQEFWHVGIFFDQSSKNRIWSYCTSSTFVKTELTSTDLLSDSVFIVCFHSPAQLHLHINIPG